MEQSAQKVQIQIVPSTQLKVSKYVLNMSVGPTQIINEELVEKLNLKIKQDETFQLIQALDIIWKDRHNKSDGN